MPGIIDFHTHAFPDAVAAKAIPSLEQSGNIKAWHNGTVDLLLASMDEAEIAHSVICSIATRVEQFQPILDWSQAIRSERITPLPSIHPADPEKEKHLQKICDLGFMGIKLHPYYQNFFLDDPALIELFALASKMGLMVVSHTGYDIAYPRIRRADPERIIKITERFPDLQLITTHLGGWDEWGEVRRLLIGRPIYMEISFALEFLEPNQIRDMLISHPKEYLLFGSDSPWADQKTSLKLLKELDLPEELFNAITTENAASLLYR